jgi:arabinose-5-phosphate isomerase
VRQVFEEGRWPGRRTGAIMIIDPQGKLRGIFTDSDLARLFESRRDGALDGPIRDVMTKNPATAPAGSMLVDAVAMIAERKISELPVIDNEGKPIGMIDITDVVGLIPEDPQSQGVAGLGATGATTMATASGQMVASASGTGAPAPKSRAFNPSSKAPKRL